MSRPEHPSLTLGSPPYHARSVIVCEDSDQLINLIATQGEGRTLRMRKSSTFCFAEGVDVRDEADEGTNAIDVDSLPKLPELSSPAAPQTVPRQQQQQQFVQVTFSPYLVDLAQIPSPPHLSLISPPIWSVWPGTTW